MTEGNFTYKIIQAPSAAAGAEKNAPEECAEAVITGMLQERRHVEVPDRIGGLPVTGIAPHAFADQTSVRSVSLPRTLHSIGAFAFHNCPQLEEISMHDSIRDFHNGVVRQDRKLRRIRLQVHEGNYTVMRDILSDTDAKLQFSLELSDGQARLLFPGYDYAFNENTMSRTIRFSISGSGMVYRECVRRRSIGFREYDRLFPRVIPDDPHAALEIAADRLLFPYDLAGVHAQAYEDYLRENAADALLHFVTLLNENMGTEASDEACLRLQLMADRGLITQEAADPALRLAADLRLTEACSLIMSGRGTSFAEKKKAADDFAEEMAAEDILPDLSAERGSEPPGQARGSEPADQAVSPSAQEDMTKDMTNRKVSVVPDFLSLEDW